MEELDILGTTTKRLTRRKPAQGGARQRTEVTPAVAPAGLAPPVLGCPANVFETLGTQDLDIRVTKQEKEIMMAQARKKIKDLPTLVIERLSYTIFSHEELQQQAMFKVTKTDDEGLNTVNDPRSGVVDDNKLCRTCMTDNLDCPGHYGIIELNQHIIHPMFRREVVDVLTSVCNSCGGLLLPKDAILEKGIMNLSGSKRLRAVAEASKKLHCRRSQENIAAGVAGCISNPVYKASKVKEFGKIFYNYGKKGSEKDNEKTVEEIEQILNVISEEDAELLGFSGKSHPRRFIMKSIPVIPICARAPVVQDGMVLKDDITSMYQDIVRYNQELVKKKDDDKKEKDREDIVKGLIFSIEHLIDNSDAKYRQGQKKQYRDLKTRIQGKEAIIRNLIQGKRVNFSARTVLGPDPNLKFGQIRIPRVWAPYLTHPETVSPANVGRLTALFKAGQVTHITPAAGRYEGRRIKVTDKIREKQQQLRIGDVVERWLQTGDVTTPANFIAFNRQPTLHKQSIMGYEVVLGDPMTIGLHLSYTTPHNADFDGDEGTVHAPQSRDAMLELALLMNVKNCIMNSQNNKNIISVVYDALTGSFLLTQPETFVDPGVFMNIISFIENNSGRETFKERLKKYGVPETSGRALFSSIFPDDFYYRKGNVLIREGILVSGVITKDHVGGTHGSIIQVLMKDYGQDVTVNFLTDIYNIVREWLDVRGFSVGLDDCYLTGENPDKLIEYEVQRAKMLVRSMGWKMTDPLEEERREKQIVAYLNTAKGLGARISEENLPELNSFNVMSKSGAKGSTFNIAQITGILGQQFVQGQRMPETLSGGRRTLPYFPEDSLDPAARGFVSNSFLSGLTPAEMFFHQAGSREGLTDTAIKSVTGDTPIIITENGKPKRVNIGDWIDELLIKGAKNIERDNDRELLRITGATIPTCDCDGNVSWGDITAVTRHDPGKELFKVKTRGGREVIVTESHSLLIWNYEEKKFKRTLAGEAKVGNYMPTTCTLPSPPVITKYIYAENYFSKREKIFGTDFLTAQRMINEVRSNRSRCPSNWWDQNNGKSFTLPYDKSKNFSRCLFRSDLSNIREGCIYPYNGKRIDTFIPDKLELNRYNGVFIGLYIAEGHACVKSGQVTITNNDPAIIKIVQEWFDRLNIKHSLETKINHTGGTSTMTTGYSALLAEFLIKIAGSLAQNKKVPIEAYTAPDEFIVGLLDGYISGDGCVDKNSICAGSASMQLRDGLCFLLGRLGIFAKMSVSLAKSNNLGTLNIKASHRLAIRAQWARRFADIVKLSVPYKVEAIEAMKASESHRDFPEHLGVVFDQIVSIEKVDISLYPKVYDLTVPSTLNFGLANGLHVVDTSETGALHHKVVKALEDIRINEDGSARNTFGVVFQYTYGEDGFDAGMLEIVNTKTGAFTSFINTKRLAARINARYGYKTPDEPEYEKIVPVKPDIMLTPVGIGFPEIPEVPRIPETGAYKVGDVVNTEMGQGTVMQVEGERVLIEHGGKKTWVKAEKLEL